MYQSNNQLFGLPGGTATFSFDQMIRPPFGARVSTEWRLSSPVWRHDVDFTTDLGLDIGSLQWFRGLATCAALCGLAFMFAPTVGPLTVNSPQTVSGSAWDETRAQSIAPLAWGADTGRRVAATNAVQPLGTTPERPVLALTATLGQGDGFARVLERSGVGAAEAGKLGALIDTITPLSDISPGTKINIVLGRRINRNQARPLDSLDFRARFDLSLIVTRSGSGFTAAQIPIAINTMPLRIQGTVGDSLYRSVRAAGVPAKAIESYLRAIGSKLSLGTDVPPDAQFDIIVARQRAETGETRMGKLLYAGLTNGVRRTQLLEWTVGGRTEWFEASGVGQKRGGMTSPVAGARQTSGYGMRFHPLLGYTRFHRGVDFGAAYGSPIRAVTDGLVAYAGRAGGYGNQVRLSHTSSLGSSYSHMSGITVSPGARVAQGQVIGYVGSTGLSTGPHLHFEVFRNGQVVNPATVSFASTSLLEGNQLASFRARLSGLLTVPVTGTNTPLN